MNPYSEGFALRAVGEKFSLSIATGLAIEAACGLHPDFPVKVPPVQSFDQVWVNTRTLFRNFMGALDPETAKRAMPVFIAQALLEEMDIIEDAITHYSNRRARVVFYYSNYKGMEKKYPRSKVRGDTTDKQKSYRATMNDTTENLLQMAPERIRGYDLKIGDKTTHNVNAMILTHYAYDLISYREFKHLVLLESHTGKIKERAQWYTKYLNGKDLAMMPFREDLLQILGDKETFAPQDIALRKSLIDLAVQKRWSATTTTDKIRANLKDMPNQYAAEMVRAILVST